MIKPKKPTRRPTTDRTIDSVTTKQLREVGGGAGSIAKGGPIPPPPPIG